jgi:hypoxanthine phosphoribosyltransferase
MSQQYREESQKILQAADLLCSRQQVEAAMDKMALEIKERIGDQDPLVLCVMTGGLIAAGSLLPRLDFMLNLDYIHATRYGNKTQGGQLDWIVRPSQPIKDRVILLIDDILDEGLTLQAIVEDCRNAGATSVYSAVLVEKIRKREVAVKADFVGLEVEDRYLFGYGMDYKGYLRNAAGIYAVKE